MHEKQIREAVYASGLPMPQRAVLFVIAPERQPVELSVTELAARAGCNKRTVIRSVAALEKAGWLHVERSSTKPSWYRITPPPAEAP